MAMLCSHRIGLFFLLFAGGMACKKVPPPNRMDVLADQYCSCTTRLAELNRQMQVQATDSLAAAAFEENLQLAQEEYDKVRDCIAPVIARLGAVREEERTELQKRLTQKCPDMAQHTSLLVEVLGE